MPDREYEIQVNTSKHDLVFEARVVFERPPVEFLGKKESYHFTREYDTHAETWSIFAFSEEPDAEYLSRVVEKSPLCFQDRNGWWYIMHHLFHNTNRNAVEGLQYEVDACQDLEQPLWLVRL